MKSDADRWAKAIKRAEETGDLRLIAKMLRSRAPLGKEVSEMLAKLLDDHDLEPIPPGERR